MANIYDDYMPTAEDLADKANSKRWKGKTKSSKQVEKAREAAKAKELALLALASGVPTELRHKYVGGTELTQSPFKNL